ncbi:hypothetical protein EVAR_57395_1 [Eumeta japonica]|uniref:Uncharacterized protein n=1 Tax=Eumeta variegata TaxID=151549 RepID=A0A4C1YEN1_EUMVA|nr:hypothetical protein EVAR_57395_1 [Eumeta japonica]
MIIDGSPIHTGRPPFVGEIAFPAPAGRGTSAPAGPRVGPQTCLFCRRREFDGRSKFTRLLENFYVSNTDPFEVDVQTALSHRTLFLS